jgi:DNA-binding IclR family transcriptional regulator
MAALGSDGARKAGATAPGYSSLSRGLDILSLLQSSGRLRASDISERLDLPLSTVYRYVGALRESGFAIDVDGYLMPSNRLAETGADADADHLVHYSAPVLRRLRDQTHMTAILAVRIHTAAVCLEVSFAHAKHRISFQRGQVRALYAGASALPLLAFAPPSVLREVLESDFKRYTSATPKPVEMERELAQVRAEGYAVSYGHLTPGMVAIGVPVIVDGRALCSLSLVGETQSLAPVATLVDALRGGTRELLARMPSSAVQEAWLNPNE